VNGARGSRFRRESDEILFTRLRFGREHTVGGRVFFKRPRPMTAGDHYRLVVNPTEHKRNDDISVRFPRVRSFERYKHGDYVRPYVNGGG